MYIYVLVKYVGNCKARNALSKSRFIESDYEWFRHYDVMGNCGIVIGSIGPKCVFLINYLPKVPT